MSYELWGEKSLNIQNEKVSLAPLVCLKHHDWLIGETHAVYNSPGMQEGRTACTQERLSLLSSKALFWHCLICGSGLFLKYISTYSRLEHFLEYPNLSLGDRREQLLSSGSATFFPYYVRTNINVGILVCKGDDGRIDNRTHVLHKAAIGVSIAVN